MKREYKVIEKDYLNDCFKYDEFTGELTWRFRPLYQFRVASACNSFNKTFAGTKAGTDRFAKKAKKRYQSAQIGGKTYLLHRIIWMMVHGEDLKIIDHINGDGTDNRLCNLRNVSQAENMKNQRLRKHNKSGVSGVNYIYSLSKWRATIGCDGKNKYIGLFTDFFEAVCARKSMENKLDYHVNHGTVRPL